MFMFEYIGIRWVPISAYSKYHDWEPVRHNYSEIILSDIHMIIVFNVIHP